MTPATPAMTAQEASVSPSDPMVLLAGIKHFGLASDGCDIRDLETAIARLQANAADAERRATEAVRISGDSGHWCLEPVVVERDALQAMWDALDEACPHVASALRAAHQSAVRPLLPGGKSDQGEKEKAEPFNWARGWTGDGVVNFAGDAFVKVRKDGEWMILHARSGGSETTISLRDDQAFEIAYALTPELLARFNRAKTAENALWELANVNADPAELRYAADEVDCGEDCDGGWRVECLERGHCKHGIAEDMRSLATALERKAALPPPPSPLPLRRVRIGGGTEAFVRHGRLWPSIAD